MAAEWVTELQREAPDVVAAWRGIEAGQLISVRREVRRRAGAGTAEHVVGELGALAAALVAMVDELPDEAFDMPGGESDWTVAEAIGHTAAARAGLVMAASLAAAGRWPTDAPTVVPGVAGPAGLGRADLVRRIEQSQRIIVRSARTVVGHEEDPCPLVHPQVGRLRCGEWLLFAGVHDVMHLEQLHRIADELSSPGRSVG
ncbi:MAG TPA: DinB family protein [Candidatus Limnocylindrales bacterium]|nr:DinB family protein [Candidatus Limnocylindrales bacterium]